MSKYLKAQELNRRIVIERNVGVENDEGFVLEDWRTYHEAWCGALMATGASMIGAEMTTGGADISRVGGSFRIRKPQTKEVTAGMRCRIGTKIYDIRAVSPDLRDNRFLFLAVAEGANRG